MEAPSTELEAFNGTLAKGDLILVINDEHRGRFGYIKSFDNKSVECVILFDDDTIDFVRKDFVTKAHTDYPRKK